MLEVQGKQFAFLAHCRRMFLHVQHLTLNGGRYEMHFQETGWRKIEFFFKSNIQAWPVRVITRSFHWRNHRHFCAARGAKEENHPKDDGDERCDTPEGFKIWNEWSSRSCKEHFTHKCHLKHQLVIFVIISIRVNKDFIRDPHLARASLQPPNNSGTGSKYLLFTPSAAQHFCGWKEQGHTRRANETQPSSLIKIA